MKKLIYSIEEERNYGGEVVGYIIANNYKGIARVSKEEGDNAIRAIKKNESFYKYEVNTTNTGKLCWTFYFEIGSKLPDPVDFNDKPIYGHCPYCGSKTFVDVFSVPGSLFYEDNYDKPVMLCKHCRRIMDKNNLVYRRDD